MCSEQPTTTVSPESISVYIRRGSTPGHSIQVVLHGTRSVGYPLWREGEHTGSSFTRTAIGEYRTAFWQRSLPWDNKKWNQWAIKEYNVVPYHLWQGHFFQICSQQTSHSIIMICVETGLDCIDHAKEHPYGPNHSLQMCCCCVLVSACIAELCPCPCLEQPPAMHICNYFYDTNWSYHTFSSEHRIKWGGFDIFLC